MEANIKDLIGKTLLKIDTNGQHEIIFHCSNGDIYKMYHSQSCCESVYIESIDQDIQDLIGNEILEAEERTEDKDVEYGDEMWTFYTIRNVKTTVNIRWNGSSNGYYSVSVDFEKIN